MLQLQSLAVQRRASLTIAVSSLQKLYSGYCSLTIDRLQW